MHFDWTVTLGAIVVVAGFFITTAGVIWTLIWGTGKIVSRVTLAVGTFQNRLDSHDTWIKKHEECSERHVAALADINKRLIKIALDLAFLRGISDGKDEALQELATDMEKRHHARRRGDPQ